MFLQVSLGGFFRLRHLAPWVPVRRLGALACLLVLGETREFGCLPVVASRLSIVLGCRVVVFCARQGNREIRWLGVPRIIKGEFCFLRHGTSLLRSNGYGKLPFAD